MTIENLEELYNKINYKFKDVTLLKMALTHPSYNSCINYQRLEFLGDGILHGVICHLIYQLTPLMDEGMMSRIYARLVSGVTIAVVARTINLGHFLFLDKNEEAAKGRDNERNLENAMEALIGAIYLDSNYNSVFSIVQNLWSELLAKPVAVLERRDYKSILQEWSQKYIKSLPLYQIVERQGPAHLPLFTIECKVINPAQEQELYKVRAQGKSRKEAEQKAAQDILTLIERENQ